jgi:hypothetical protein
MTYLYPASKQVCVPFKKAANILPKGCKRVSATFLEEFACYLIW